MARAGSTSTLALFAFIYFATYVFFGVALKYFQGAPSLGFPGVSDVEFLVYSTGGSASVCLGVVLARKWWKAAWSFRELCYISAAGTCTALVIPTTKLMYSLPISVMVAMILMRGSIIVVGRLVDAILIRQGISKKKVRWPEDLAVAFALLAVGVNVVYAKEGDFAFLTSVPAMVILITYIAAYSLRIYLMIYFKFTRDPKRPIDKKNYFGLEQLATSVWVFGFAGLTLFLPVPGGAEVARAITEPHPMWFWALLAGVPFGVGAFFSVFLFLFEGRTATFSSLANRLASLLAGTVATLVFAVIYGGKFPKPEDWIAFGLILIAVALLAKEELAQGVK